MQFLRRDRPCDLDQGRLSRIPPDDARAGLNGSDVLGCLEAQTRGGGRLPAFQASRMAFEDRSGHFPGCDPMSALGPGCVKTCTNRECAELFSLFSSYDGDRQSGSFLIERNRDKLSPRKFDVGVFTQAGSKADLTTLKWDFRSSPNSGHRLPNRPFPKSAKSGL